MAKAAKAAKAEPNAEEAPPAAKAAKAEEAPPAAKAEEAPPAATHTTETVGLNEGVWALIKSLDDQKESLTSQKGAVLAAVLATHGYDPATVQVTDLTPNGRAGEMKIRVPVKGNGD